VGLGLDGNEVGTLRGGRSCVQACLIVSQVRNNCTMEAETRAKKVT
jgi:hypothetical protein